MSKQNFILKDEEQMSVDGPQLYYPCDTANAKGTNHLKNLYWYVFLLYKNVARSCVFWHEKSAEEIILVWWIVKMHSVL